jgi:cytochrome P450
MSGSTASAAPLYPPHVRPAARPLRFPFNLVHMLDNYLKVIPEQAYREPIAIAPGPPRMAFITGGELLKGLLLTRHAEFPKGRLQKNLLRPLYGNNMLASHGEDWRWQRTAAAPLFRYEELLQYGPFISAAALATVEKWRAAAPATVHVINKDMMHATFEVISKIMLAGGAPEVIQAIEKGHADYYKGINWWIVYILLGLPHWLPRPGGRLMRAHERRLRGAITALVQARRDTAGGKADLLGRMLAISDPESGRIMSDELLVDNIIGFLMAGYETTAFSLTWTLYLISQSPEWEARMVAEIARVVGAGPVTAAHVASLTVVQQVLNESLRLYPSAPVIVRDFHNDVELDGIKIPAGTIGIIPIYAIHRHRDVWDDPDRFDPDRFAPERASKPARYQFMPFGAGPRVCLGASLASIELTIMLATFVRAARFEVEAGFAPQPVGRMFLVPRNGMPMRVTMRESGASVA